MALKKRGRRSQQQRQFARGTPGAAHARRSCYFEGGINPDKCIGIDRCKVWEGKTAADLMRSDSLQRGSNDVVIGGLIEKIIGTHFHGACSDFWKGVVSKYDDLGLRVQGRSA